MPAGRQWQLPLLLLLILLLLFWWQLWTARAASNGFCLAPAYPFIPLSLSHSLSVSLSLVSFLFTWRDFYLLFTRNFVTAMTPALIGHALHTHTGTNTHRDKHTHTHFGTATNCETRALYAIWVKVLTKQQCSSTLALPLQLQLPLVRCATCPVPRASLLCPVWLLPSVSGVRFHFFCYVAAFTVVPAQWNRHRANLDALANFPPCCCSTRFQV